MKIAVYNEKGGAGKTTAAVMLAVALELPLLDLDPQATATQWLKRRVPPHPMANKADSNWVADCPPGISPSIGSILAACALILVPVRASFADLVTLPDTIKFLRANTDARLAFIGSDVDRRTNDEATLRETLAAYELPVVGLLAHRASYRRAGIVGKLASEIDQAAADELSLLINSIQELKK